MIERLTKTTILKEELHLAASISEKNKMNYKVPIIGTISFLSVSIPISYKSQGLGIYRAAKLKENPLIYVNDATIGENAYCCDSEKILSFDHSNLRKHLQMTSHQNLRIEDWTQKLKKCLTKLGVLRYYLASIFEDSLIKELTNT
jgi:hypothetical protein